MQARIEELERRLEEQQAQKTAQEEQVALLEKSYEIAARYMNGGQAPEAPRQKTSVSGKASVQPVRPVRRNIVSLLAARCPIRSSPVSSSSPGTGVSTRWGATFASPSVTVSVPPCSKP